MTMWSTTKCALQRSLRHLGMLTLVTAASCQPFQQTSKNDHLKEFVVDRSAKNVAVFLGAPSQSNFLAGVAVDIKKNEKLFQDIDFGFEVISRNDATLKIIKETSIEAATKVSPNGTLLWYFSGHGLENGDLYAHEGRPFQFNKEILPIMKEARKGVPFKRMIIILDSCFSGMSVNGQVAILPSTGNSPNGVLAYLVEPQANSDDVKVEQLASSVTASLMEGHSAKRSYDEAPIQGLFLEGLVIAASKKSETSGDSPQGGVFSENFRKEIYKLYKNKKDDATLVELLEGTKKSTTPQGHTPVFRAIPSDVFLKEKLFVPSAPPSPMIFAGVFLNVQDGQPIIHASATGGISNVVLCEGDRTACMAQPTALVPFEKAPDVNFADRAAFRATQPLGADKIDRVMTLLGYGPAGGQPLAVQSIKVTKWPGT